MAVEELDLEDGSGSLDLEDGSGALLLESSNDEAPTNSLMLMGIGILLSLMKLIGGR